MSDQDTIISKGREALARVKEHTRRLFEDYLDIGDALNVGRSECLKLAGSNSLQTPTYRAHWRRWLDDNGFGDMDGHERLNAMYIAEHKAEVSRWRDGLGEVSRRHANHPNVIVAHMKAGTQPAARGPKTGSKQQHRADVRRGDDCRYARQSGPRPELPAQDKIRFVAAAMRQGWTSDVFRLATIAIEAADRYDAGLMPAPREIQHEMELHA
jgi:hypothetical protein